MATYDNKNVPGAASFPLVAPLDMQGRQLFNVAPATDSDDVVTIRYLEDSDLIISSRAPDAADAINHRRFWLHGSSLYIRNGDNWSVVGHGAAPVLDSEAYAGGRGIEIIYGDTDIIQSTGGKVRFYDSISQRNRDRAPIEWTRGDIAVVRGHERFTEDGNTQQQFPDIPSVWTFAHTLADSENTINVTHTQGGQDANNLASIINAHISDGSGKNKLALQRDGTGVVYTITGVRPQGTGGGNANIHIDIMPAWNSDTDAPQVFFKTENTNEFIGMWGFSTGTDARAGYTANSDWQNMSDPLRRYIDSESSDTTYTADGTTLQLSSDNQFSVRNSGIGSDQLAGNSVGEGKLQGPGSVALSGGHNNQVLASDGSGRFKWITSTDSDTTYHFAQNGNTLEITGGQTLNYTPTFNDTNTTYSFADGTNGTFTVTPSDGSPQTVSVGVTTDPDSEAVTGFTYDNSSRQLTIDRRLSSDLNVTLPTFTSTVSGMVPVPAASERVDGYRLAGSGNWVEEVVYAADGTTLSLTGSTFSIRDGGVDSEQINSALLARMLANDNTTYTLGWNNGTRTLTLVDGAGNVVSTEIITDSDTADTTYTIDWDAAERKLTLVGSDGSRDSEIIADDHVTNVSFDSTSRNLTVRTSDTDFVTFIPVGTSVTDSEDVIGFTSSAAATNQTITIDRRHASDLSVSLNTFSDTNSGLVRAAEGAAHSSDYYIGGDGAWHQLPASDSDTTYTLHGMGRSITLSGSDGSTSEYTLPYAPDSDTTYALDGFGSTVRLTSSGGVVTSYTVPDNNTTYTGGRGINITADSEIEFIGGQTVFYDSLSERNRETRSITWVRGDIAVVRGHERWTENALTDDTHPVSVWTLSPHTGDTSVTLSHDGGAQDANNLRDALNANFANGKNTLAFNRNGTGVTYTISNPVPTGDGHGNSGLNLTINPAWHGRGSDTDNNIHQVYFKAENTNEFIGAWRFIGDNDTSAQSAVNADWVNIEDPLRQYIDGGRATYTAGTGLALNGNTFSIRDGGVGTDQLYGNPGHGNEDQVLASRGDGSFKWVDDNDTTYSAGTGLNLSGTTFSIADNGVSTSKIANQAVTTQKLHGLTSNGTTGEFVRVDGSGGFTLTNPGFAASNAYGFVPPTGSDHGNQAVYLSANGTWENIESHDSEYAAGRGLDLNGRVFSVDQSIYDELAKLERLIDSDTDGGGGRSRFINLMDTPVSYDSEAHLFTRVNEAEDALEFFNPFPVQSNNQLNVLNGRRIRMIHDTYIEFAGFTFGDGHITSAPATPLHWDQPFQGLRFSYTNETDYMDEYVNNLTGVMVNDTDFGPAVTPTNMWQATTTFSIDSEFLDTTTRYTGGSSNNFPISGTMHTNLGQTKAVTGTFVWGAAGWATFSDNLPSSMRFDSVIRSYDITIGAAPSSDFPTNTNSYVITTNNGTAGAAHSNGNTMQASVTGATVYYDTTIQYSGSANFVRPTGIQTVIDTDTDSDRALRTVNLGTGTRSTSVNDTAYPIWIFVDDSEAFNSSLLGTLGDGGYSATPNVANRQNPSGGSHEDYVFTNSESHSRHAFLLSSQRANNLASVHGTSVYPLAAVTRSTVTLGQPGHTVTYQIASFVIEPNATITIRVS